jgi:hypothetical protein
MTVLIFESVRMAVGSKLILENYVMAEAVACLHAMGDQLSELRPVKNQWQPYGGSSSLEGQRC